MAGGKLTPRQKMINLMYLIFIAMLALNMSKEVLSAFGILNVKIVESNAITDQRNEGSFAQLAQKAVDQPGQFGDKKVKVEKIRGQKIDLRHILRIPKVTTAAENEAKDKIEKIKKRIEEGELTFAEAAKEFSDEKETASDGGIMINPVTQDRMFELKNLPPDLYPKVQNLKEGEISIAFNNPTRTGKTRYEIYTVSDRLEEHEADFALDYVKIKEFTLQAKRIKAIEKWQNEKIAETYIKLNGTRKDCEGDRYTC